MELHPCSHSSAICLNISKIHINAFWKTSLEKILTLQVPLYRFSSDRNKFVSSKKSIASFTSSKGYHFLTMVTLFSCLKQAGLRLKVNFAV